MYAYSAAEWQSLFVAEAGASAALAGLLFVAISIYLARILQGVGLSGRAGEAVLLVAVLVVSTLALVPASRRRCSAPSCWRPGWSPGRPWSPSTCGRCAARSGHPRASSPAGSCWPRRRCFRSRSPGCHWCRWWTVLARSRGRLLPGGRGAECVGAPHRDLAVSPGSRQLRGVRTPAINRYPTARSVAGCSASATG